MKRTKESSRLIEMFIKAGLVAAIAAALLVPTTVKVSGSESTVRIEPARPMPERASRDVLPLPPVPYLETMPWLVREPAPKGVRVDWLLGPKFEPMQPEIAGGGAPPSVTTSQAKSADEAGHASL